ncbi:MAG: YjfB family protein [Lachnospiraceae bacterium]|nr:YjfB family protein [Lachnospiraceae bacterium]
MSPDSIPALSVMMSQSKVSNEVSTSMLKKTLDVSEQGGEALIQMMRSSMELSVNPSVGGNFDVSV